MNTNYSCPLASLFAFIRVSPFVSIRVSPLVLICASLFVFISATLLLPFVAHGAVLSRPPSNLGLVGYWSMNEGTSTIAGDFSGSGHSGNIYPGMGGTITATSSMWVNGTRGKALNFDGTDDVVKLSSTDFLGAGALTISAWIKPNSYGAGTFGRIVDNNKRRLLISSGDGNKFVFTSDAATNAVSASNSARIGEWQHVVATSDASGVANIYINGVLSGTADQSSGTPVAGSGSVYIGNNVTSGVRSFDGIIDEVRIYNRALSASEVASLYKTGAEIKKVANENGLIASYTFDDGAGTIAGDSSGNRRNATMVNMSSTASWVTGKHGKALLFDASDDYVQVPSSAYKSVSATQGTIMGWAYPTTTCSNCFVVWGFGGASSRYYIQWTTGWAMYRGTLTPSITLKANAPTNRWYHLALTWEGGTVFSGYLDGQFVASTTMTGDGAIPDGMTIGKQATNPSFPGMIDDIKLYNRTLTASEIKAEYTRSSNISNSSQNKLLTSGLVGLWSFNGADVNWSTGTVYDRSGSGNNGSVSNMSTTTSVTYGKVGQAFNFDGSNDYVSASSMTGLSKSEATISVWVKPGTVSGRHNIIAQGHGSGGLGNYTRLYQSDADVIADVWVSPASNLTTASSVLSANTWTHIAFVNSVSGSRNELYINGVLQTIGTVYQDGSTNHSYLEIGDDVQLANRYFGGSIDEVRIYSRALSPAEVKQLYLMGR